MVVLYLFSLSHTQQKLQSVSDSLKVVREESNAMIHAQKAKSDSLESQMRQINQESPSEQLTEQQRELLTKFQTEQSAIEQHERQIKEAKRQIDLRIKEMGIEQMLDTLSCQINAPIPILRVFEKMLSETEEPELKEYIEKRYRRPCLNRFFSLPVR